MTSKEDCYRFYYKEKSYLVPKEYIHDEHPGGGDIILPYIDKDITDAFDDEDHSMDAIDMLEEWREVEDTSDPALSTAAEPTAAAAPAIRLNGTEDMRTKGKINEEGAAGSATSSAPAAAPLIQAKPGYTMRVFAAASIGIAVASMTLVYVRRWRR